MSAWLCSDDTFRLLVQAHTLYGLQSSGSWDEPGDLSHDDLCTMLYRENVKSLQYRYPDEPNFDYTGDPARTVRYEPVVGGEAPQRFKVLVLKSIHCYRYQSCEHPEWEESEASAFVDLLHDEIRRSLGLSIRGGDDCGCFDLPGFDAAPWGFQRQSLPNGEQWTATGERSAIPWLASL